MVEVFVLGALASTALVALVLAAFCAGGRPAPKPMTHATLLKKVF